MYLSNQNFKEISNAEMFDMIKKNDWRYTETSGIVKNSNGVVVGYFAGPHAVLYQNRLG